MWPYGLVKEIHNTGHYAELNDTIRLSIYEFNGFNMCKVANIIKRHLS